MSELYIHGIPATLPEAEAAILRSRLLRAVDEARQDSPLERLEIRISTAPQPVARPDDESEVEERAARYQGQEPVWRLAQLIAPVELLEELRTAVAVLELEPLVFDTWGLREIEPFPRSALNFHGPPGTGKTLAAHAVAHELRRPLLAASYAQVESKYHGDGPKNVEALFHAARRDGAVLFLDEADSLLSRRLTNVTQGSEQAINSMRSQILICLEQHRGVVIFATNLVANYDEAFETRVRHIYFPLPDLAARKNLWQRHLPATLPVAPDLDLTALADHGYDFCGRDIKNAVVAAALQAARAGKSHLAQGDFFQAIDRIMAARRQLRGRNDSPLIPQKTEPLEDQLRKVL